MILKLNWRASVEFEPCSFQSCWSEMFVPSMCLFSSGAPYVPFERPLNQIHPLGDCFFFCQWLSEAWQGDFSFRTKDQEESLSTWNPFHLESWGNWCPVPPIAHLYLLGLYVNHWWWTSLVCYWYSRHISLANRDVLRRCVSIFLMHQKKGPCAPGCIWPLWNDHQPKKCFP